MKNMTSLPQNNLPQTNLSDISRSSRYSRESSNHSHSYLPYKNSTPTSMKSNHSNLSADRQQLQRPQVSNLHSVYNPVLHNNIYSPERSQSSLGMVSPDSNDRTRLITRDRGERYSHEHNRSQSHASNYNNHSISSTSASVSVSAS